MHRNCTKEVIGLDFIIMMHKNHLPLRKLTHTVCQQFPEYWQHTEFRRTGDHAPRQEPSVNVSETFEASSHLHPGQKLQFHTLYQSGTVALLLFGQHRSLDLRQTCLLHLITDRYKEKSRNNKTELGMNFLKDLLEQYTVS